MARPILLLLFLLAAAVAIPFVEIENGECPDDELYTQYPDDDDCKGFFICLYGKKAHAKCPSTMLYNAEKLKCDKAERVACNEGDPQVTKSPPVAEGTTTEIVRTTTEDQVGSTSEAVSGSTTTEGLWSTSDGGSTATTDDFLATETDSATWSTTEAVSTTSDYSSSTTTEESLPITEIGSSPSSTDVDFRPTTLGGEPFSTTIRTTTEDYGITMVSGSTTDNGPSTIQYTTPNIDMDTGSTINEGSTTSEDPWPTTNTADKIPSTTEEGILLTTEIKEVTSTSSWDAEITSTTTEEDTGKSSTATEESTTTEGSGSTTEENRSTTDRTVTPEDKASEITTSATQVFETDETWTITPDVQEVTISVRQLIPTVIHGGPWTSVPEISKASHVMVNLFFIMSCALLIIFQ